MYMPIFDEYYMLLIVPAFLVSLIAQMFVKINFNKFSKVASKNGRRSQDVAQMMLEFYGITDVGISTISGSLTDNYNPLKNKLYLSETVYDSTSVAAIAVACHEAGHAIQKHKNYLPLLLRSTLVPAANIGSFAGPYLIMIGLLFGNSVRFFHDKTIENYNLADLVIAAGILLFSVSILFYLVTLPVEFDASRRAYKALKSKGFFDDKELIGVKKVLGAAAMTYVASALSAVASLLRFILLANSRRRNR